MIKKVLLTVIFIINFTFLSTLTAAIDIPLKTWVKRDLPGIGNAPFAGKHARFTFNSLDKRLYELGGDYSHILGAGSKRNELYSYSVVEDEWRLEYPDYSYCGKAGEVQPMHPDEIGFVYDTKRNIFWMIPGHMGTHDEGTSGHIHCDSELIGNEIMTYSTTSGLWSVPDNVTELSRAGGGRYAVYDPITDTIIRFNEGNEVDIYDIQNDQWTTISLSASVGVGVDAAEYAAIDVEGRVIYFINQVYPGGEGWLYRYHIDTREFDYLIDIPDTSLHNLAMPVWDSVNKVLLWPRTYGYKGFVTLYIYHPDTNTWETDAMIQPQEDIDAGVDVRGNAAVFDPDQNVLMIMGGRNDYDGTISNPYLFLYRYGNGDGTPPDTTPPTIPQGLNIDVVSGSQIDLSWQASTDAESGISSYKIYRDNVEVGASSSTSYSDPDLTEGTTYTYRVSAVSFGGESDKSTSVSATTLTDTTPPTIISVGSSGDPNKVTVTFSESVEHASATTAANYQIDNSITVSGASLGTDLNTVTLTTSEHSEGINYTLTVNNINDRATAPNTVLPDTQRTYTFTASFLISNLSVTSGENYVWDTLDNGKQPYIDRSFTFTTVPSSYIGLNYLKTANDDKGGTDNPFITFDVNQSVTVYVAHSVHITPKPTWLTSWTDTSEEMVTSDTTLHLYKKDFAAGTVMLGGNEGGGLSMYSVFVKSAPGISDTTTPSPPNKLRKRN